MMRFDLPPYSLDHFSNIIWVYCPQCDERGEITTHPVKPWCREVKFSCQACHLKLDYITHQGTHPASQWFGPFQEFVHQSCAFCGTQIEYLGEPTRNPAHHIDLECTTCTETKSYHSYWRRFRGNLPIDHFFGLQLWLQTTISSHTLWFYNLDHLDYVRTYVSATQREDSNRHKYSIITHLPQWVKSKKNREVIIKKMDRLARTHQKLIASKSFKP